MLKWKNETGANSTCYWLNLSDDIEVSLFKGHGSNTPYLYNFTWGADDTGAFCHWTEHMSIENWDEAKSKGIAITKRIISSYLSELNCTMEELSHG